MRGVRVCHAGQHVERRARELLARGKRIRRIERLQVSIDKVISRRSCNDATAGSSSDELRGQRLTRPQRDVGVAIRVEGEQPIESAKKRRAARAC
jgi:hypothetical protein